MGRKGRALSLSDDILAKYPAALKRYLDAAGPAMALLDGTLKFLAANKRFLEMAGWTSGQPEGALGDCAEFMEGAEIPLPPPERGWNVNLVLTRAPGATSQKTFFIANEGDAYVLFASNASNADEAYMAEVSALNAELTNLARELKKKQRALERANERIAQLARTDSLTGLANRREFHEQLSKAAATARRHAIPLSVALADIDHFKSVNDDFGHDAGDQALKMFADLLAAQSRTEDLPARWGGEEFIVMMPATSGQDAIAFANRVRALFAETQCDTVPRSMTVSFGVATLAQDEADDSLISRADEALYRAKREGRNRAILA